MLLNCISGANRACFDHMFLHTYMYVYIYIFEVAELEQVSTDSAFSAVRRQLSAYHLIKEQNAVQS
jgi:hypothetical protein